ncbi:hypothetical protein PHMEG_00014065 [Phytophthora megakarya]|uniref:Uncharacterized protein n=1 Tax=Phytophthora megakarya TaxID=4795 RepID=A0A225W697_9STRA|nr:hypothetical protein PHMEG_00014065 [Phytophthora megakarya]
MRPFLVFKGKYLWKYARHLNSVRGRMKIIKPQKNREGVEVIAAQLRDILKTTICTECLCYSASRDIIPFTLHYLTEAFEMKSWVLEVQHLPGKHDGYRTAPSLENITIEWSLPIDKCVKCLQDGATNDIRACVILGFTSISCLAYCLHLIVGAGIAKKNQRKTSKVLMAIAKTDDDFDAALEQRTCEEVGTFITESCESARDDLYKLRVVVEKFRKLAIDCATCWNSTYAMLLVCWNVRRSVDSVFDHAAITGEFSKQDQRTAEHRLTIRCLMLLLEPFEITTNALGGQKYPTLAMAIPVLRSNERRLKSKNLQCGQKLCG